MSVPHGGELLGALGCAQLLVDWWASERSRSSLALDPVLNDSQDDHVRGGGRRRR